jgi:hypothetical protein
VEIHQETWGISPSKWEFHRKMGRNNFIMKEMLISPGKCWDLGGEMVEMLEMAA